MTSLHLTSNQGAATVIRIAAAMVGLPSAAAPCAARTCRSRECAYAMTGAPAPILAVAITGDIDAVRADNSARRRFTAYGRNSNPQLSSPETLIAYLFLPCGGSPVRITRARTACGSCLPTGAPTAPAPIA